VICCCPAAAACRPAVPRRIARSGARRGRVTTSPCVIGRRATGQGRAIPHACRGRLHSGPSPTGRLQLRIFPRTWFMTKSLMAVGTERTFFVIKSEASQLGIDDLVDRDGPCCWTICREQRHHGLRRSALILRDVGISCRLQSHLILTAPRRCCPRTFRSVIEAAMFLLDDLAAPTLDGSWPPPRIFRADRDRWRAHGGYGVNAPVIDNTPTSDA